MKALTVALIAAALVAPSSPLGAQDFFTPPFDPVVAIGGETPLVYPQGPVELVVTEAQSAGQFGMVVVYSKPDDGPGKSALLEYKLTETFYVLEGQYRFFVGDEVHEGGPGTVVVNPPKVPHGFTYIGDGIGKLMILYTPAENGEGKGTGFFKMWASQATRSPEWIEKTNAEYGVERTAP